MRLAALEGFDRWMARHPLAYASLVVLAASVVLVLFVDLPLSIWLQSGGWARLDGIFNLVGQLGRAEGWIAAALLAYVWANWTRRRLRQGPRAEWCRWLTRHINLFLLTLLASTPIIHLLKNGVARFRPALWYRDGQYGFGWPFAEGFPADAWPSGHTQTAFAVAAVMALVAPRWRLPVYLVAGLVGLSRLVNGAHYLSDVVAGAFIAIATCFALKSILLDPARQWPAQSLLSWPGALLRHRQSKASPASTRA
jgi:membrane-associated phospholipid phosphatase